MIIDDFEANILSVNLNNKLVVNRICRDYLATMKKQYTLKTVKGYLTKCRKVIQAHCPPPVAKSACQVLKLDSKEYYELNKDYREKVFNRSFNWKERIDPDIFIQTCMNMIDGYWETHKSYIRLSIGIAGLTGRRFFSEIIGFGRFKIIGPEKLEEGSAWKHQTPAHAMMFSGHSKARNMERPPYIIPVLGDSKLIYHGWRVLREEKPVIPKNFPDEMHYLTRDAHKITVKRHYDLYQKYRQQIIEINETLKKLNAAATPILREAFDRSDLQIKDLRSIYASVCYKKFKPNADKNPYISMILGHSEYDYTTAQSYKNFED